MAYSIWYFTAFYLDMILVIIFCYWRILAAIRRQPRVMAGQWVLIVIFIFHPSTLFSGLLVPYW